MAWREMAEVLTWGLEGLQVMSDHKVLSSGSAVQGGAVLQGDC
jgi:hypothetical protein